MGNVIGDPMAGRQKKPQGPPSPPPVVLAAVAGDEDEVRQPFDHPDVLTHAIHGGSMPVVRCAVSEDAKKLKIFSSANCFVDSVELPVPIWHLLKEDIASLHERNYPLDTAAWRGHIEILRRQSRVPAAGLSSANFEGPAFENGRDEALLRAAAAKPPLRGPDRRAEAVRLLLDLGAGIGDPALFDPSRPLEPNLDVIRLLIEAKSDLSALDKGGRTPLHAAAALNSVALVRALLDAGADPDGSGARAGRKAPLHLACEALAVDTALLLLERGADPHRAAAGGARPLHCCAWPRHNSSDPVREAEEARNNLEVEEVRARILAIADALLARGAEIDAADDDGATFFTIAAAFLLTAFIATLEGTEPEAAGASRARPRRAQRSSMRPFAERFASEAGAAEEGMRVWRGARRLAPRRPDPDPDPDADAAQACLLGLRLTALRLARAAPSVHTPAADALGRAPLYHAAARGPAMLDVCGALLDRGAELTPAVLNATRDGEFRRALKERAASARSSSATGTPVDVARFALRLRDRLQSDGVMARPAALELRSTPLCCG
eukprot:tig00020611_g12098.t1